MSVSSCPESPLQIYELDWICTGMSVLERLKHKAMPGAARNPGNPGSKPGDSTITPLPLGGPDPRILDWVLGNRPTIMDKPAGETTFHHSSQIKPETEVLTSPPRISCNSKTTLHYTISPDAAEVTEFLACHCDHDWKES